MVNRLKLRIDTVRGYTNYVADRVDVEQITNGVEVTFTYYRSYGNRVNQYIEVWVVKGANVNNYLDDTLTAYIVNVPVERKYTKILGKLSRFKRRWF